jgi:hypothetical protein
VCAIFVCRCWDYFVNIEIDEVVECVWHKKMHSRNSCMFLEHLCTKAHVCSRNTMDSCSEYMRENQNYFKSQECVHSLNAMDIKFNIDKNIFMNKYV